MLKKPAKEIELVLHSEHDVLQESLKFLRSTLFILLSSSLGDSAIEYLLTTAKTVELLGNNGDIMG